MSGAGQAPEVGDVQAPDTAVLDDGEVRFVREPGGVRLYSRLTDTDEVSHLLDDRDLRVLRAFLAIGLAAVEAILADGETHYSHDVVDAVIASEQLDRADVQLAVWTLVDLGRATLDERWRMRSTDV